MSFFTKLNKAIDKRFVKASNNPVPVQQGKSGSLFDGYVKGTKKWLEYGSDDCTPVYLENLASKSAVHNAILKSKSMMVSGDGVTVNGVEYSGSLSDTKQTSELNYLINNPVINIPYQGVKDNLSDDYCINGSFAYLVTWNTDFTKVASYKPLLVKYLRPSVDGKYWYYYEGDWKKARESDVKKYPVYNKENKESYDQIVFEKDGNKVFGVPTYQGGIEWIEIDIEMGVFHKYNIKNGMNPGLHFRFFTQPQTEQEKQNIINQIKNDWQGAMNTGRFVPTFSPSRELATEVTPIETSGLDKQLLNLTELCDRKILSAHQLTSPLLAGISVSGQLGANVELKTSYLLWSKTIIAKMTQKIDNSLQKHIFDINVPGTKIQTKTFDPLEGMVL